MKIAVILPSLANRGPILIAKYLVDNWIKEGKIVEVYYFDDLTELNFGSSIKKIKFNESIDFGRYDIIHSHMLRPDLYLLFHKFRIPSETKIVTTIHQETYKALKLQYNFLVAFLAEKFWSHSLRIFDKVIVLNKTIAEQIKNKNLHIIGNGIPKPRIMSIAHADLLKVKLFKDRFDTIIGSSTLLIKRKGIDQVIKVLPENPNVGYIILGDGEEKEDLKELAAKLGVTNQCLFMGQKINGYRFFQFFDIYMLPSHSEGFPICGIEAAMFGLPIVCSNIKVLEEIFKPSEVSFFQLEDIDSLNQSLQNAIDNKEQLKEAINEKYYLELSDKVMVSKYNNLFKDLINVQK
ncbi:glycosyltransferase family 4 protein [Salegentibacter sp. T436]|uniref:glycosyltransferase family 4 protein n=1 Tax=Salegentibacter sp. T436 TaxID=1729720 RepID=UPI00094A1A4C|nr:glycosyltransferase family 4 protein [Salegentibacter sp. T436]APS37429.1 hypothetical protein AO058_00355 [Salegentibacter sp. T436]